MTHINQRRDTAANWASANPVLQEGEVGWDTTNKRSKLGDGIFPWNDLDYTNPAGVTTVNGRDGDVVLTAADVDLGAVDNTDDNSKPVSGPQQAALDTKVDAAYVADAIAASQALQRPIGSLYFTVDPVNPGTLFGGTWIAWGAGRVPVGVNAADPLFDTVEETGGEAAHVLTTAEMPSHGLPVRTYASNPGGGTGVMAALRTNVDPANTTVSTSSTANVQTGTIGSGTAHNNLQPYITCYIWKRTA
jgi:hypothetical protein